MDRDSCDQVFIKQLMEIDKNERDCIQKTLEIRKALQIREDMQRTYLRECRRERELCAEKYLQSFVGWEHINAYVVGSDGLKCTFVKCFENTADLNAWLRITGNTSFRKATKEDWIHGLGGYYSTSEKMIKYLHKYCAHVHK